LVLRDTWHIEVKKMAEKKEYKTPRLVLHGSVEEITKGKDPGANDGYGNSGPI
jgi:hypothetical protein